MLGALVGSYVLTSLVGGSRDGHQRHVTLGSGFDLVRSIIVEDMGGKEGA